MSETYLQRAEEELRFKINIAIKTLNDIYNMKEGSLEQVKQLVEKSLIEMKLKEDN